MKILSRALLALDRVWKFADGTIGLDEFDTRVPIQPVADMQRVAELGAIVTFPGAAGYFQVGQDNVHAAGGETVDATIDPYASLDASWGVPGARWIWLMNIAGSASSAATFGAGAAARLNASIAALGPALARRDFFLKGWVASESNAVHTSLSATFPVALTQQNATGTLRENQALPFPLFEGTVLTWRTTATAAQPGTIRLETLCWVGPVGVMPPSLR